MSQHISYRPDIDGLRALAVMAVVACHARLGLTGGFVGVDVFFVISGFLIATLIRKDQQAGEFSLIDFWMRRIRRLTPALLVVVAATLVAGWFWMLPEDYANLGRSVKSLLLLRPNIHFMYVTNYFGAAAVTKPLLHTWSLGVEEQFYLVVPFAMLLLARVRRISWQVGLLMLALAVSLGASIYGTHRYPVATFYLMPTRAWEFLVGMLLSYCPPDRTTGRSLCRELAAWTGLASILLPVCLYDEKTLFPGLSAMPPVLGAALLIWAGGRPVVNRFLSWRPVVFVGMISYSLYLWHWPVMMLAQYREAMPLPILDRVSLVFGSLLLGAASWRFVETPFRTKTFLATRPRLLMGMGTAVLALYATGVILYSRNGFEKRISPEAARFLATGAPEKDWMRLMTAQDIPDNMIWHGDRSTPPSILVWGDSYAMVTNPAIESLSRKTGVNSCMATRLGTPPLLDFIPENRVDYVYGCLQFNDAVMNYLRKTKIPTVILVARWSFYVDAPEGAAALLKTVDSLNTLGIRICFMREVPRYPFDVPRTLARHAMLGRDFKELALPAEIQDSMDQMYGELLPKLTERGVTILDPLPFLRSPENPRLLLPYTSDGSLYIDPVHLSKLGAVTVEPMFAPVFESAGRASP
ncbi:acyltransferase family protein [Zavarzinella formosa]|uniref:acyltransferase family protein n=1 Tax=Zavarzinella formosa TaxID=360055 RepID=UPI0002D4549E|nr:acyltransferase family protein [Zavarzinella formosa]